MIGVAVRPEEIPIVEEFFELFKTPWEFHRPGSSYDVILSTLAVPPANAKLVIICRSQTDGWDEAHGIVARSTGSDAMVSYREARLPIYGRLTVFAKPASEETGLSSLWGPPAIRVESDSRPVVRVGYDLFAEVEHLLVAGQPIAHAAVPTLDLHIQLLREWILDAGIAFVEIPPIPAGHSFAACLTHDIDFVGIRQHFGDHSMWGFLYRATFGGGLDLVQGRISVTRLLKMWRAVVLLPFVFAGWARDFWEPFEWYLRVEANLPATYFLIPFKRRHGERVETTHAMRRATAYDVSDIPEAISTLTDAGCEIGVHGIDAWHSVEKGRDERSRLANASGSFRRGIRMHWLLQDEHTAAVLEKAGFAYDSTHGYNDTVGFRSGTTQVFRPLGCRDLLELPLHIQDGALFFANRLNLTEQEAWTRCAALQAYARSFGGVLTLLWHDRSHAPERFWGEFYERQIATLKKAGAWFGTASQIVEWFRVRRSVRFQSRTELAPLANENQQVLPPLTVRFHSPAVRGAATRSSSTFVDVAWNGRVAMPLTSPEAAAKVARKTAQLGSRS